MPFTRRPARTPRWILAAVLTCAPPLAGCVTSSSHATIPESLRAPCAPAAAGPLRTQADLEALVLRQEGALLVCDQAKAAVIAIVDGPPASRRTWGGGAERRP